MNEIWKEIPGYEGYYEVSNIGRVKTIARDIVYSDGRKSKVKNNVKSLRLGKEGYYQVDLKVSGKSKTFRVHQLVAMAFLNHTPCSYDIIVDHIDANKLNNNLSNLQCITQRANTSKNNRGLTSSYTGVHKCGKTGKFIATIRINGKKVYIGSYINEIDASNAYKNNVPV